jgi:hypothetical protein
MSMAAFTVEISPNALVRTWRDGEWVALYVEDGSGAKTTVSLTGQQALDLASAIRGAGVDALSKKGVHA